MADWRGWSGRTVEFMEEALNFFHTSSFHKRPFDREIVPEHLLIGDL
jgi:hypothetical protein